MLQFHREEKSCFGHGKIGETKKQARKSRYVLTGFSKDKDNSLDGDSVAESFRLRYHPSCVRYLIHVLMFHGEILYRIHRLGSRINN